MKETQGKSKWDSLGGDGRKNKRLQGGKLQWASREVSSGQGSVCGVRWQQHVDEARCSSP